ncbi:hypothetical protein [Ovoidimarina sediminis]|uniref:hypothetical protein n=1 Tax=Ovoidimarina sediminis TaxID=3079856 RepID=UPI00290A7CF1|nr:hypothetical protein [Rhodophyticola sp. MJ-SS7]MDU8943538.1 hypothetical protein [Rhodophyticola sp. MJ-SS7]
MWRVIGEPNWPVASEDIAASLGNKPKALLAYLIVSGAEVTRQEIAEVLWPDVEQSRARHNLRQALLTIRQALGDAQAYRLGASGDILTFDMTGLDSDLARLAEIESGAPSSAEEILELCRGPLLNRLDARSATFDDRLREWRGALDLRVAALLGRALDGSLGPLKPRTEERLRLRRAEIAGSTGTGSARGGHPDPVLSSGPRGRGPFYWIIAGAAGLATGAGIFLAAFAFSPDFRVLLRDAFLHSAQSSPRIAVRPFTSVNAVEKEQNLAGGVTIGVTYALYAITARELFVVTVPPSSDGALTRDARDLAGDLGVRYLISGALEWDGNIVRVFVRCYDAELDADVWQDRFDSDVTEAFRLQDEITLRILRGLNIDLSSAERNRIQYLDDTESLEAWLLAANGVRNLIKLDPKNLDEAYASYRRALDIDPDYISARRGLAWHDLLNVRFGSSRTPEADLREARNHIDVILRRRPEDGMSRAIEGLMLLLENNWEQAIDSGLEATRLLPGSADVWAVLAHSYTFAGEPERALDAIERAMELSPGHPDFYNWIKGRALRLSGSHDAAIELLERNLKANGNAIVQLVELAAAYAATDRIDDARRIARLVRQIEPSFSSSEWVLHPAMSSSDAQSIEFELLSKAGL